MVHLLSYLGACNLFLLCLCSRYHQAQCISLQLSRQTPIISGTKAKLLLKRLWWVTASLSHHCCRSSTSSDLCSSVAPKLRKFGACVTQEEQKYASCASTVRSRSPTAYNFFLVKNKNCFHEITSAFECPSGLTKDVAASVPAGVGGPATTAVRMGRGGGILRQLKRKRITRQKVWESFVRIFMPEYRNRTKIRKGLLQRVKVFLALVLRGKEEMDVGEGIGLMDSHHHLSIKYKPGQLLYRIQKELKDFTTNPPIGCSVDVSKNMKVWIITITDLEGSVYEGECFRLRVAFPSDYPTRPPSVYFLQTPPPPKHEHIYTNGDICLSLLGKDWKPNLTISGLTISIVSMLTNATEKRRPQDNANHAKVKPGGPQTDWVYHDHRS